MLRRGAISGLVAAALAATVGGEAGAAGRKAPPKVGVTEIKAGSGGTTLTLAAKAAPYPMKGSVYDDPTVVVFVPASYRLPASKKVDVVVHFHGHNTTARRVIGAHALREQVVESKQNAILVVPQGPVDASDGDFGKLMKSGGVARLLSEVLELCATKAASKALGDAGLGSAKGAGRVVASAHSGGYRAAAAAAQRGGVDLREVYLFDALYGELGAFADFASEPEKRHKLVSYAVAGKPLTNGEKLAKMLEARGVDLAVETGSRRVSRAEMVNSRAVFLLGSAATHASATYQERALRDCMLASCLVGHDTKAWHAAKQKQR
ncbi:MAG: hypothetical protein IPM79_14025 [Polyangiaceae bacterium]|nr:hypothetical protein [Polyangiaceae bacterium]MBK8938713.1 hypothetical protein [Polyangiaceae bacterium]